MEARLVSELPVDAGWQFEPKWDGFRCLAFRAGREVELRAKSGKSLARFFPEMLAVMRSLPVANFVLDGELTIAVGRSLSFDALQMRLHPAESRIRKLAVETPATFVVFDCLLAGNRQSLIGRPLHERRAVLEELFARLHSPARLRLSPYTPDRKVAQHWLEKAGGVLDGVVAKRRDGPYVPGERAMLKVKRQRTADCVVGGFRYATNSNLVGSLLLGLYDHDGKLDHVGFTSSISTAERGKLTKTLEKLIEPPGFTGDAPGARSRWSNDRSAEWEPLRAELVVEVSYDQVTADRFRHGTRLVRWRPDKSPRQCTFEQLQRAARPSALVTQLLA